MKICRFERSGKIRLGVVAGGLIVDLSHGVGDIYELLGYFPRSLEVAEEITESMEVTDFFSINEVKFLPPIPRPPKIVCLGLNYADHAEEIGMKPPKEPILFSKSPTAVIGHEDGIKAWSKSTDYEVELAIIIGKECRSVSVEDAEDYVLGFTILNDVSARDVQIIDGQFFRSKSLDTFAPIGPWITTQEQIENPDELEIECRLNGRIMQHSNTKKMIFHAYEIISFISKSITLESGDIIGTGTPGGVGSMQRPPRFLKPGDVLELTIQNIGTLKNVVEDPKA